MAKKSRRVRRSMPVKPTRRPTVATQPRTATPDAFPVGPQAAAPALTTQAPTAVRQEDYSYVVADLKRIALFTGSIVAILAALSFIIK
jgi:hypothetical protein